MSVMLSLYMVTLVTDPLSRIDDNSFVYINLCCVLTNCMGIRVVSIQTLGEISVME